MECTRRRDFWKRYTIFRDLICASLERKPASKIVSAPQCKSDKYLKTAFLNHWNLLAFLGRPGFALLYRLPDVLLPLVLPASCLLGLLGTHPKFQPCRCPGGQAKAGAAARPRHSRQWSDHFIAAQRSCSTDLRALRSRCLELRQIAAELRQPGAADSPMPLEYFQVSGLDRLLWIHLRLLFTQYALTQFL